jgi:hypothetical protein
MLMKMGGSLLEYDDKEHGHTVLILEFLKNVQDG